MLSSSLSISLVTLERRSYTTSDFQWLLTVLSVFLDNGYYNKAIAASPVHALPGYIMGGISWFAIPWLMATTCGLAALALEGNPAFPTFPNRMDPADVSAGLVVPYAAVALLGGGGAVAVLLIVFMAVTSASSAELIAVSSIFTYDIYQTYFNPGASGKRLIYMSHACVVAFGLFMAAFSVGRTFLPPISSPQIANKISLLRRYLNGLSLRNDGRNNLIRRHPRHPNHNVGRPQRLGRNPNTSPRPRMRAHSLARNSQENLRKTGRRLHRLQQSHVSRKRHGSLVTTDLYPALYTHLRRREVRLEIYDGY